MIYLIDLSENDEISTASESSNDNNANTSSDVNHFSDNESNDKPVFLICNNCTTSDDPDISDFLSFCIKNGYFDNTFYDYKNTLSVIATKLPVTYGKLCGSNKKDIKKNVFVKKFKNEFGYKGN